MNNSTMYALSVAFCGALAGWYCGVNAYNKHAPPRIIGVNGTVTDAWITNKLGNFTLDDLAVLQIPEDAGETRQEGNLVIYSGSVQYCLDNKHGGIPLPNTWGLTTYQSDNYLCDERQGRVYIMQSH